MATETEFRPPVKPQLLVATREGAFLSKEEAARRIGVPAHTVSAWESGERSPTIAQLRKAATAYQQSIAAFLLADPPNPQSAVVAFRTLRTRDESLSSPTLAREVKRLLRLQSIARHLSDLGVLSDSDLGLEISMREDPEECGAKVRSWLNVTIDTQVSSRRAEDAFRIWRDAIEAKNIVVAHVAGVPLSDMRAIAERSRPFPVIGLNGKESAAVAKIFSLMHELVHILISSDTDKFHVFSGLGDSTERDAKEELFCNRVAGSLLVPESDLVDQIGTIKIQTPKLWQEDQLKALSQRYKVSREVVILRLVSLGLATNDFYEKKRADYEEAYRRLSLESRDDGGGGNYYRLKVRDMGPSLVRSIVSAYESGEITSRDATSFLGVRPSQIETLKQIAVTS